MRRNSKKGAIELGMNTIIIVVIGITLLSLSLVWLRGMMTKLEITTDTAFEQTDFAINQISQDTSEPLSVWSESVTIAPGKFSDVKIALSNLENTDLENVRLKTEISAQGKEKATCIFPNFKTETGPYKLPSGSGRELKVRIQVASDSPLGTASCTITASGMDADKQIFITIEK